MTAHILCLCLKQTPPLTSQLEKDHLPSLVSFTGRKDTPDRLQGGEKHPQSEDGESPMTWPPVKNRDHEQRLETST